MWRLYLNQKRNVASENRENVHVCTCRYIKVVTDAERMKMETPGVNFQTVSIVS